jgi:membrane associated rhomboid family serine protease
VVNWLIILATVGVFCLQVPDLAAMAEQSSHLRHQASGESVQIAVPGITGALTLNGWEIKRLFGHMWLHLGPLHLAGNMLFLWIFGNALCAKVGNLRYLLLYVLFGITSGATHLLCDPHPALGASGAINGVVGMYLVLFYQNEITCLFAFWFIVPYVRWFDVSGIWIILFWLFWDVVGVVGGGSHVANFAHLGGFATGFGIAFLLCRIGWITMEEYEKSLWQAWQEWRRGRKDPYEKYYGGLAPLMKELKEQEAAVPPAAPTPAPKPIPMIDPTTGKVERDPAGDKLVIVGCACGKCIRATRQYAGKLVTCPHCKAKVRVPDERASEPPGLSRRVAAKGSAASDGYIRFRCHCGKVVRVPAQYAGQSGTCPRCHSSLRVPRSDAAGESA